MRDFKNMKRQRGRNRSGGMGGGGNNGGGGKLQQNANRAFDSNGPDNVKIRGHAQHVFEKYQQLARDAFSSGDRVVAENYLQHADHYFRVLRTLQPQRSPSEILGRDSLASGLDIDFEEEFDQAEEQAEAAAEAGQEMNGGDAGQRQEPRDGQRYDREGRRDGYEARDGRQDRFEPRRDDGQSRDPGQAQGQGQYRDQGPYREQGQSRDQAQYRESGQARDQGQYRDQGQSRDRQDGQGQSRDRQQAPRDRPEARDGQDGRQDRGDRFEGRRDNRRFEGRREDRPFNREASRDGRPDERRPVEIAATADPPPVTTREVSAQPFPVSAPEAEASPVLRSQDGGMSEAPAFLQPAGDDAEARKPRARRRRAPRSFEAPVDGEAPVAEAEDA